MEQEAQTVPQPQSVSQPVSHQEPLAPIDVEATIHWPNDHESSRRMNWRDRRATAAFLKVAGAALKKGATVLIEPTYP